MMDEYNVISVAAILHNVSKILINTFRAQKTNGQDNDRHTIGALAHTLFPFHEIIIICFAKQRTN